MQKVKYFYSPLNMCNVQLVQVGRVCPDWQNDVVGKPESDDSNTVRGVVQIASMFAKGVAESGVLSDQSSLAVKALATVAQG